MENLDLKRAFMLIDRNKELSDFIGKKTSDQVELAEKELELKFPPSYRTFVKKYGCGDIAGAEFYGIISEDFKNSGIPDVVWLTINEREASKLPNFLLLISSAVDGAYYAIDTSRKNKSGECPIIIWYPGQPYSKEKAKIVAKNFGEFLFNSLESLLE